MNVTSQDPALAPNDGAANAVDTSSSSPSGAYLSCRFIERAATFYPGQVTACCANPATGRTPVIAPFKGGELSSEALLQGREQIIARHKAGDIVPECQGCPRLTKSEWLPHQLGSYPIDEVTIAHFSSCNIRCNYCYTVTKPEMAAPLSKAPRILSTFQDLIDRKLLAPYATVRFSGGEPTLSPEFEPLLMLLANYGVRSVIYTNAVKRSDAIMAAIGRDKVELILGIDAATVEVYKSIKKMNYNEKVWEVVAEYCGAVQPNATNKIWAKFIFCLENYQEAEHFIRRVEEAGARHVYYDFDASRSRKNVRGNIALPEEVTDYVAVLRHECMKRGIEAEFAQAGLAWLTAERTERIERELSRLNREYSLAGNSRPSGKTWIQNIKWHGMGILSR